MKFFKWLGKSRENDYDPFVWVYPITGAGESNPGPFTTPGEGGSGICKVETKSFGKSIAGIGGSGGFSSTPSPITFYPPIEEKEK